MVALTLIPCPHNQNHGLASHCLHVFISPDQYCITELRLTFLLKNLLRKVTEKISVSHMTTLNIPFHYLATAMRPEREADHSPLSSAELKNAWSYTSGHSYVFVTRYLVKHRDKFIFTLSVPPFVQLTKFTRCCRSERKIP